MSKNNELTIDKLIREDLNNTQAATSLTPPTSDDLEEGWFEDEDVYEGQLSVDVFQTLKDLVIKSAIAGIKPEDIDISLHSDTITVKGVRKQKEEISEEDYFCRECYWGGFSRSIILPVDIKSDQIKAEIENGILTITLPKANKPKVRGIKVKDITEKPKKKKTTKN